MTCRIPTWCPSSQRKRKRVQGPRRPGSSTAAFRDHFLPRHPVSGDILSTFLKPAQDLEILDGTMLHVTRTSTSAGDVIRIQGNSTVTRKGCQQREEAVQKSEELL
jgi:hypothetical protein